MNLDDPTDVPEHFQLREPETRDTDRAPFSPEEEMPKLDRSTMTTDQKLDAILDRLEEGDARFLRIEQERRDDAELHRKDWVVAMNYMKTLNVTIGRELEADRIQASIDHRFPNGADDAPFRDEKTSPGG